MSSVANATPAATRADLEALPDDVIGEIIDGVLYTFPRPRPRHAYVQTTLASDLDAFQRGQPGGWWILVEPGLDLEGSPEVVPDLAGWRRERVPELPEDQSIHVVPDWVCEILSPTTRGHDQLVKRRFYARVGVQYLWFIDPEVRTLSVCKLIDGRWSELGVYGADEVIHAEPFHVIAIDLAGWWPVRRDTT